ncbi:Cysteine--tRNA ligase, mitochondrial [Channa argus]|uniref:Cysteine--tRNA ligase, mitochondrial n=1 Tax=Channa argus TaxID=215402 RepID=A0A6G1QV49_CHAAH|nr:Cysteine--tRNA ligase, mitochondrial [Channa argus]
MEETLRIRHRNKDFQQSDQRERASYFGKRGTGYMWNNNYTEFVLVLRYSCGPTVYDHAHLGHACSYVRFDILQRILSRLFGITVIHAMVITDIDDKIIKRSWEENVSPTIIARMYEEEFKRDMLSLKSASRYSLIEYFESALVVGDVYFEISSIGDRYGRFVGAVGTNAEPGSTNKRDPRDFALWKRSKPQEPCWQSPWGSGRPGWHIECSTIASCVFGSQLDIHSGGIDLAFPHHENEIAQSEAYHQCQQWANYFLHSAIYYSDTSMSEARTSMETISNFIYDAQAYMKGQLHCSPVQEAFLWKSLVNVILCCFSLAETKSSLVKALADDFDTPRAISAIMNLVYLGNCQLHPVSQEADVASSCGNLQAIVEQLTRFRNEVRAFALAYQDDSTIRSLCKPELYPERIPLLKACDTLRNDLAPLGVLIKDRGATSTWEITEKKQSPIVHNKAQETHS